MTNIQKKKQWWRVLMLSSLGGAFDFYDFVVFASFAVYIGQNFFPEGHPSLQLIQTFALFAAGYLVRPLGGFILSHIGDKYGRKKVFIFSVSLMGVSTLLMGLLPTYSQIGVTAPILLLIIRMLQGFALGGELPGSITFVYEHTRRFRGFATGFLFLFINLGLLLGQGVHTVLLEQLTSSQMATYGWRIAFLLGGILALASYFVQRNLDETPVFKEMHQKEKLPLYTLFKKHSIQLMAGMLIVSVQASLISILYLFMPGYLASIHFMSPLAVSYMILAGLILLSIINAISGLIADLVGKRVVLSFSTIAIIVLTIPLYHLFIIHNETGALTLFIILSLLTGGVAGSFSSLLSEMFPAQVRYTAVSSCYNIAFAIFGGFTPLIASLIIKSQPGTVAIGWTVVIPAFLTLLGVLLSSRKTSREKSINELQSHTVSV